MSEGKDARVAGASVRYAAIRYRNAAQAARKRGEGAPSGTRWRGPGPGSCSVRPRHGTLSG